MSIDPFPETTERDGDGRVVSNGIVVVAKDAIASTLNVPDWGTAALRAHSVAAGRRSALPSAAPRPGERKSMLDTPAP